MSVMDERISDVGSTSSTSCKHSVWIRPSRLTTYSVLAPVAGHQSDAHLGTKSNTRKLEQQMRT
jgi:hypothetical protein